MESEKGEVYPKSLEKGKRTVERLKSYEEEARIGASEVYNVLELNKNEPTLGAYILKKIYGSTFQPNQDTEYGRMFEKLAIMLYGKKNGVKLYSNFSNFNSIRHQDHKFLVGVPDAVIEEAPTDPLEVGKLVEIKCTKKEIYLIKKPEKSFYYPQVQTLLEVCDVEECYLVQCKFKELSRQEFESDMSSNYKGALLCIIPGNLTDESKTNPESIYGKAKYIVPDVPLMSPGETQKWIQSSEMKIDPGYVLYKVNYWLCQQLQTTKIERNRSWFDENIKKMEKVWRYIEFFRHDKEASDALKEYMLKRKNASDSDIMDFITKAAENSTNNSTATKEDPEYEKIANEYGSPSKKQQRDNFRSTQ